MVETVDGMGSSQPAFATAGSGWHAVAFRNGGERTQVLVLDEALGRIEHRLLFDGVLPPRGGLAPMGRDEIALVLERPDATVVLSIFGAGEWSERGRLTPEFAIMGSSGRPGSGVVLLSSTVGEGTIVDPETVSSDGQILAAHITPDSRSASIPFRPILSGRCLHGALVMPDEGGWVLASDCVREAGELRTTRYCVPGTD